MIRIRPSDERGRNQLNWLDTHFTFSFDQYYDPQHMQFRSLRVLNEDTVAPGQGFGMHPHRDMEILTWILEGALEHRDSMGTGAVIRPGELQHMTAGSGVLHSEFNPSPKDPTHLLQIWITPERKNLKPEYEQLAFPDKDLRGKFHARRGAAGSGDDSPGRESLHCSPGQGRPNQARLESGSARMGADSRGAASNSTAQELQAGDGAAISKEDEVQVKANEASEVLLFDLA